MTSTLPVASDRSRDLGLDDRVTATTRPRRRDRPRPAVGSYTVLVVAVVVMVLPLVWTLLTSIKPPDEIYSSTPQWFPDRPRFANYSDALARVPMLRFLVNSVVITAIGAGLKVVLGLACAYALVFVRFPAKKLVFVVVLAALMVPVQITLIPNYTLVSQLGWLNTYQGIVVPGLASAFGTFLFRQHFLTLPRSLIEAATLDGAGHWRRLWQFVVPISAPTIAAVGLVAVVTEWNAYLWPLLVTDRPEMMTLPVGLTLLQNADGMNDWGVLLAAVVLAVLPVLAAFLALQRHLVAGLTAGSLAN